MLCTLVRDVRTLVDTKDPEFAKHFAMIDELMERMKSNDSENQKAA